MLLHSKQKELASSKARFKIARAGRKGGKTSLEIETLSYKAVAKSADLPIKKSVFETGRKVIYIAPTQLQARNIVWEALKNRLHSIGKPNEQLLQMKVLNADGLYTTIYVGGWENRENYRGLTDVIHITFDEVDTLKSFFIAWLDIFRPMFLDTGGTADFIGTPDKRNPNLKRLEKEAEGKPEWECFHWTSRDNPFLPISELNALEKEYDGNRDSYTQEVLAQYVDNAGSLFRYESLVDMFTNTITKSTEKFHIVDIADDGSDKTVSSLWEGLELYQIDQYERLNTEGIISMIREKNAQHRVPYSQTAVDAIGVGAGVVSSSLLDGIIGFKSSYQAIRTDQSIIQLPNVHYLSHVPLVTEYKNLRSQCIFFLAQLVNNHQIACRISDVRIKERIIEELALYQDASQGDGKRMATQKEDIKALLGRSPDLSDTLIMRCYFQIRSKLVPAQSEDMARIDDAIIRYLSMNKERIANADTR